MTCTSKYNNNNSIIIIIIIILIIVIIIIIGVNVGSCPENSIVGYSKGTKESTGPVRKGKRETWDLW